MAVGDVIKLSLDVQAAGQKFRPGLHFQGMLAGSTPTTLISAWRTSVEPAYLATAGNEFQLHGYDLEDRVPGTAATVRVDVTPPLSGAVIGDSLPYQDAVLFSLRSALKSQRARGRVYWPGVTESQHTTGELGPTAIPTWEALATAIRTTFVGTAPASGWQLVIYSPEDLTPPKPPPVFKPRPGQLVTAVSTVTLATLIKTQRRRQRGVGQ